jgi:uncharacterized OsmC-like protein
VSSSPRCVLDRRRRHQPARILGLSDEVRNGYQQIKISFVLRGDDPDKLRQIVEQSCQRSAVFDIITNGVPVAIEVDAA